MSLLPIKSIAAIAIMSAAACSLTAKCANKIPHLSTNENGVTELIVNDRPFIMLAGELTNSGGSTALSMADRWANLKALNLNTLIAPVSWEQVEPQEGTYDFSIVDSLICGARRNDMKLVLLWFGSWKNGTSGYAPEWVMSDTKRFPRMKNAEGRTLPYLSNFNDELVKTEAVTFGNLMKHIGEIDGDQGSVVMMQVENEMGILGDTRDRSKEAERRFNSRIPRGLADMLLRDDPELLPELKREWETHGRKNDGTWAEALGNESNYLADEAFMAWHYASHVERLAAEGKKRHPIPMVVNAWTIDPKQPKPGTHPSGGPNSRMIDIYKAAAPSIDIECPDNYRPEYRETLYAYSRKNNPIMVPEAVALFAGEKWCGPAQAYYTIANHAALGFSPFAIDNPLYDAATHPLGSAYKTLANIMPVIIKHRGTDRIRGFMMDGERHESADMGKFRVNVHYNSPKPYESYGLVIRLSDNEYLVSGFNINVSFSSLDSKKKEVSYGTIREGKFVDGEWQTYRYLGGDEAMQGVGGVKIPPVYTDEERTPHMVTTVIMRVVAIE